MVNMHMNACVCMHTYNTCMKLKKKLKPKNAEKIPMQWVCTVGGKLPLCFCSFVFPCLEVIFTVSRVYDSQGCETAGKRREEQVARSVLEVSCAFLSPAQASHCFPGGWFRGVATMATPD